jgi:fibronectin type 3 domain-containing protein
VDEPSLLGKGYFVRIAAGGAGPRTVSLYRTQAGAATRLIGADANWTFDTRFHTVKVVRDLGNRFSLYLDGALIGTATDATFSSAGALIVRHQSDDGRSLEVDSIKTSAAAGGRLLKMVVEIKPVDAAFDGATGLYESQAVLNGRPASVTAANLAPGRYRWRAFAVEDPGRTSHAVSFGGNPETESDFVVAEASLPAPARFRGTAVSPGSILWEWDDVPGEGGYAIHDDAHSPVGGTAAEVTGWTEEGLSENTPYSRHVHAVNAQGEGPASDTAVRYTRVHDPAAADFALAVVSSNRIDVTVTPPPNASAGRTACRIERSPDGTNWTAPPIKSFDEAGYSKSDTGLDPETTYFYRIAYRNGDGVVTAASPVRSATTLPLPPPAPTGLAAEPGDRQVTLRWNAVAQATGYRVKRALASGGPYDVIAGGLTATSWTDTSLVNGVRYYYVVTAVNAGGESPPSAEASATPGVPPPPTNLAARVERGIVTLTWDASPTAMNYNVYRGSSPGGPYTTLVASGVTGTTTSDAPNVFGTTYYYVVTGRNLYGEGRPSNEASAFIPPRPAPPTNVRTIAYATVIDVEWDPSPSPDVAGYNVYRKTGAEGSWILLNTAGVVLNTRYRDSSVQSGQTYYYRVTAVGR